MTLAARLSLLLAAAITLAAISCRDDPEPSTPDDVVFMAGFKPQANLPFVAAYVAQERGYFADQNLSVDIRHASSGEHLKLLMSGDVDFTTAAATSVLKRRSDPELPIVAFALFGQKGQQAYVALESSGIQSPADWEGKTFGYKISVPPDYLAIVQAEGVDRSKISEVNAGFDVRVLTNGKVDVLAVFKSNEPNVIRNLGFETVQWDPADFGVPNMGLTLITRQQMVDERADVVEGFLKATMKAMEDVLADEEGTLDIIMKYAPNEDREHQRFMLKAEIADGLSGLTDGNGFGWMADDQWQALYTHLVGFEALPQPFDYRTAYSTEFLELVYKDGELVWP